MGKLVIRSNLNLMGLFAVGSVGSYMTAVSRSSRGSYSGAFVWNIIAFAIVTICGLMKYMLDRGNVKEPEHPLMATSSGGNTGPAQ